MEDNIEYIVPQAIHEQSFETDLHYLIVNGKFYRKSVTQDDTDCRFIELNIEDLVNFQVHWFREITPVPVSEQRLTELIACKLTGLIR